MVYVLSQPTMLHVLFFIAFRKKMTKNVCCLGIMKYQNKNLKYNF